MPLSPSAAQRAEQPVFMSDLRPQQPASSSAAVPVGEGPGSQTGDGGSAITGLSQWQKSPSASSDVPPKSMVAAVQPLAAADFAAERSRSEFETAVASIPADEKSGDYLTNIDRFAGHCYARWQTFPVRIHIPLSASAVAKNALDGAVHAWAMNIPIMVVSVKEPADIEIAWIDRLPPKQLGMTNLEVFNGHMRATIYLLRPDAKTSAGQLQSAAEHELGHALGLWGHSPVASDVMHLSESPSGKAATISPRDINTLKKVYQAPALPEGFEIPQPVGWSLIR
jgi:predicted Zn-dependent protease